MIAEDIESNFWKEHFSHLQHKNMVRINAERLTYENVPAEIEKFGLENKDLKPVVEDHQSFITWEIFITDTIKLRLFFQYQIKGSLMQLQGSDFVKIADAKFPYNPFPEIKEFLNHLPQYEKELEKEMEGAIKSNMKIKIAGEFIKAYLNRMFESDSSIIWNIEPAFDNITLSIDKNSQQIKKSISVDNFVEDLNNLQF